VIHNLLLLRRNARVLDELDVATAFATLAKEQKWTRPVLNLGLSHRIVGGRHPIVETGLWERGQMFVKNDCYVGGGVDEGGKRLWVITGFVLLSIISDDSPNMGGKSTFLRQNAIISILAQVGSYVPAEHAEIGIVDQVFSRVSPIKVTRRNPRSVRQTIFINLSLHLCWRCWKQRQYCDMLLGGHL